MCTSPIKITNRTTAFTNGHTRHTMYVPCGKCEECRSKQAESWFLRIYQEIEDYNTSGGRVIFSTFTYNDEHLPLYFYVGRDGSKHAIPCFDKQHVVQYIQAMRDWFRNRYGKDTIKEVGTLRFFWPSEYGESEGSTYRPHYHPLIFIPKGLFDLVKTDLPLRQEAASWLRSKKWSTVVDDESLWQYLLRMFWQIRWNYGFVRWNRKNSIFVTSEFAGLYASKYVTKDLAFWNQPQLREYLFDEHGDIIKERLDLISDYLPKHWQSRYFGKNLLSKFDNVEAFINGIDLKLDSEVFKGKPVYHKMPSYINKLISYQRDEEHDRDVYTQKGIEYRKARFLRMADKFARRYLDFCDKQQLRDYVEDDDFQTDNVLKKYQNIDELHRYITSILVHFDVAKELYCYNTVWSGKFYDYRKDGKNLYPGQSDFLTSMSHEDFINYSADVYFANLYCVPEVYDDAGIFLKWSPPDCFDCDFFDTFARFDGFSELLDVISAVTSVKRRRDHIKYLEDRRRRKHSNYIMAYAS